MLALAAYKLWRKARCSRRDREAETSAVSGWTLFLATLLNPKSLVFAALLMPDGTLAPDDTSLRAAAFLIAMIVASGVGWIAAGAVLNSLEEGRYSGGLVERGCALVLLALAALLTTSVIAR